jgi:hypothetical protein
VELTLWDEWSMLGREFSKRHILQSDEQIRFAVIFDDVDETIDKVDDQWMTCLQPYWANLIGDLPRIIIDPSEETGDLWPGINKVLEP